MGEADMANKALPTHPTLTHPITGEPLRAIYVSEKTGRAWWPILGGDGSGDGGGQGGDGGSGGSGGGSGEGGGQGGGSGSGGNGGQGDASFPADKTLAEMTEAQRTAYWQDKARKHEQRVKDLGNLTPQQLTELREKAGRADQLERDLMSDNDKKVAEARDTAKAEADATYRPRLVRSEFKAELKGRVPDEELDARLDSITEPLDLAKFLTDGGDVDTAKVKSFVDNIAPAKGGPTIRRGPTATGHGGTGPGAGGGSGTFGEAGKAQAEKRFGKQRAAAAAAAQQ
jgi:hypothetical protein